VSANLARTTAPFLHGCVIPKITRVRYVERLDKRRYRHVAFLVFLTLQLPNGCPYHAAPNENPILWAHFHGRYRRIAT
jgi:hypothetical protein